MAAGTTHEYLVRLRDVILEEREFTKKLDMDSLALVMQERKNLFRFWHMSSSSMMKTTNSQQPFAMKTDVTPIFLKQPLAGYGKPW